MAVCPIFWQSLYQMLWSSKLRNQINHCAFCWCVLGKAKSNLPVTRLRQHLTPVWPPSIYLLLFSGRYWYWPPISRPCRPRSMLLLWFCLRFPKLPLLIVTPSKIVKFTVRSQKQIYHTTPTFSAASFATAISLSLTANSCRRMSTLAAASTNFVKPVLILWSRISIPWRLSL